MEFRVSLSVVSIVPSDGSVRSFSPSVLFVCIFQNFLTLIVFEITDIMHKVKDISIIDGEFTPQESAPADNNKDHCLAIMFCYCSRCVCYLYCLLSLGFHHCCV